MNIQIANINDVTTIKNLLNEAYRGENSKQGWTSEADLISGKVRTSNHEVALLITTNDSVFLKYINKSENVIGCVNLQVQQTDLYLGMLAVAPNLQAKGIGKQLLIEAEQHAKANNCNRIYMTVISVRKELIDWYLRNNYIVTNIVKPFPTDHASGVPNQKLEFVVLEKFIF